MKKFISLVTLCWLVVILCPSANGQWEGAQVQRLTYNDSPNEVEGLYIDKNDKLFLFYHQHKWDPHVQPYRDTLLLITKEREGQWSQPEKMGNSSFDEVWYGKHLGQDPSTGIVHIIYTRFLPLDYDTMFYTNSEIPDWQLVKIDSLTNTYGARYDWLKMAFDTLCNVHLTWHVDYGSTGVQWYRVMYANNSTGEWVKQQVSPPIFLGGMGSGPSYLGVQENGTAHIVYHGDVGADLSYYVRNDSLNSQTWHRDTIPRPTRPLYYYGTGPIRVDVNDTVHLITGGCIEEDCVWPGMTRTFYWYKQAEDSIWQGPEQIPDTTFGDRAGITQLLVDKEGIPYVSYGVNPGRVYFTDRKQGFWQEPYQILDTANTYYAGGFCFVLDSEAQGHGVFAGYLREFTAQDDSLEIFYYGAPLTSVEDTLREQRKFSFKLFQNYPNPFNSVTSLQYAVNTTQNRPVHTTLEIYNILGKEVKELVNRKQPSGNYIVSWDGKDDSGKEVASGIYFYRLTVRPAHRPEQSRGRAGNFTETKKLVLIK